MNVCVLVSIPKMWSWKLLVPGTNTKTGLRILVDVYHLVRQLDSPQNRDNEQTFSAKFPALRL